MKIIKSPQPQDISESPSIFLAGSIEMGKAEDWQEKFARLTANLPGTVLNPRRDSWDASWEQSIDNPVFKEQVTWELDGLDKVDYIVMYFDPDTKSPITLLELGLHARQQSQKILLCCPEGFFRKGNVDIVCERYNVRQFNDLESIVRFLKKELTNSGEASSFPLINQLQQDRTDGNLDQDLG